MVAVKFDSNFWQLSAGIDLLTDARREMLLKWKKEKELKKKMDVAEQAKKKPFKVVHIDTEMFPFQKFTQSSKVFGQIL